MKHVLLVDDEKAVLEGLQNVLWKDRARFKITCAVSGKDAVEILFRGGVDILVTDMMMPEMNGLELLEHVRLFHPEVVRISLSGYAESELVVRASAVAHQQLGKPCDPAAFRACLDQAAALHGLLAQPALRKVIGALGQIPTAPSTFALLDRALRDPNVDFAKLARIVERDLGIAARILKLVNSAYFGASRTIGSLEEAINRIGLGMLRHLVLSIEVVDLFPDRAQQGLQGDIAAHGMSCARMARRLAEPGQADLAFAGGLLHGVGRLALAARLPDQYAEVVAAARAEGRRVTAVERESLGADHAQIGAYLLGLWGLPAPIVEATAHHDDDGPLPPDGSTALPVPEAVRVAHLVTQQPTQTDAPAAGSWAKWRALAEQEAASPAV